MRQTVFCYKMLIGTCGCFILVPYISHVIWIVFVWPEDKNTVGNAWLMRVIVVSLETPVCNWVLELPRPPSRSWHLSHWTLAHFSRGTEIDLLHKDLWLAKMKSDVHGHPPRKSQSLIYWEANKTQSLFPNNHMCKTRMYSHWKMLPCMIMA